MAFAVSPHGRFDQERILPTILQNGLLLAPDETRRTRSRQDDALFEGSVVVAWSILIVAGLLEAAWAIGLKFTDGFTKPIPSILTALGIVASLFMLSVSARTLPIGTAYAVWVGIGAVGTAIIGMAFLHEPVSTARVSFLALLIVALIGLKATAP